MVIFHSYVSLPEGTINKPIWATQWWRFFVAFQWDALWDTDKIEEPVRCLKEDLDDFRTHGHCGQTTKGENFFWMFMWIINGEDLPIMVEMVSL